MLSISQQTSLHVFSESAFFHSIMQRTPGIEYPTMAGKRHAKLKACPSMRRLGQLPRVVPRVLPRVLLAVLPRVLLQQGPPQLPLFPPQRVLLRQGT